MHANIYRGLIFYIRPARRPHFAYTSHCAGVARINVHLHYATRVRPVQFATFCSAAMPRDAKIGGGPLAREKKKQVHRENHTPKVERVASLKKTN